MAEIDRLRFLDWVNAAGERGGQAAYVDLSGLDLRGLNLTKATLTGANLSGANLERANLEGAKLTGATLAGAVLIGAKLMGADLNANLANAFMTNADLTNADLTNASLEGANLTGANLTNANLTCANLTGANLTNANLTDAKLMDAGLSGAVLMGAKLMGADLSGASMWDADLGGGSDGREGREPAVTAREATGREPGRGIDAGPLGGRPLRMSPAHRIESVEIHDDGVALVLASGRRLRHGWVPRLANASPAEREAYVILEEGASLHWPALFPEGARPHVSVHGLLWEERMDGALARLAAAGHDLSKLEDDDQDVVVLFRLEADVNNGGFMQFLCNWGDGTVQRALRVLETLGATRMHGIVREMRGILVRLEDDPRITQLWDLHGAMTAQQHARMGELDKAFWAYPDDLPRLAAERYVG